MFKRATPEACGIESGVVEKYLRHLEKRKIHMHSVVLCRGYNIFGEYYWAPFNKDFLHRMYSQTKSLVSIAIGFLLDEGKLTLDDKIADYFSDKIDTPLHESLKKQTVRNMLMMSTAGYGRSWFEFESPDRARIYFNREGEVRCPGTIWEYDSQGSQILCCLVERLAGKSLFEYLNEKLFSHLGTFKTARILKTPTGESWGDSALLCTSLDMLSFGRFVMNYGKINGEQLLSESYLREATSKLIDNCEDAHGGSLSYGYGYQIWRTEQNGFAFVGMGDELTICLPDYDLIFVCTADNQGSGYSRNYIMNGFFDIIVDALKNEPLKENKESYESLESFGKSLELFHVTGDLSPLQNEIDGVKYVFPENELKLKELTISFDNEGGELRYVNENGEMILPFYLNKNRFVKFPELGYSQEVGRTRTTDGSKYDCAVSAAWVNPNKLMVFAQIIDKYFGNVTMCFGFNGDCITVTFYKTAEDFLWGYDGQAYGAMDAATSTDQKQTRA